MTELKVPTALKTMLSYKEGLEKELAKAGLLEGLIIAWQGGGSGAKPNPDGDDSPPWWWGPHGPGPVILERVRKETIAALAPQLEKVGMAKVLDQAFIATGERLAKVRR
jgi:hypothetical protein